MRKLNDYEMTGAIRGVKTIRDKRSKYQTYLDEFMLSLQPSMYWQCETPKEFDSVRRAFSKLVRNTDIIVRLDYNDLVVGFEYYE